MARSTLGRLCAAAAGAVLFATLFTTLPTGLAGPAAAADDTVSIGLISPLTGTNAVQGLDIQRGVRLAVDRLNAGFGVPLKDGSRLTLGPGLLGQPVGLIIEDTESRPASAMDAVRKLVNVDDVPAIIGEYSSGVSVPTGQFTNENGTIQISVGSTSPALREIGPYFFNAIGLDNLMGSELARFAVEDTGAKNFTSIVPNNPFGVGMEINACNTVTEDFEGSCVSKVRYELEKADYRPEIRQLFAPDPEAGFYTAYGTEARLIFRQAYELGLRPPKGWYADYVTMWANLMKEIPEAAEGVKGLMVGVSSDFFDNEYGDAYEAAYGEAPISAFGAYGYDAMMLLALAIDAAGSTDADAIATSLHDVSAAYQGVTGDKTLDADGMQVTESYQRMIYTNGELQPYVAE